MSRKKEGAALAPEKLRVEETTPAESEVTPNSVSTEKVGITGLPVEEQRKNLIKVAVFLIGAAVFIAVLKFSLGW